MNVLLVWLDTAAPAIALVIIGFLYTTCVYPVRMLWLVAYLFCTTVVNATGNIMMIYIDQNNHRYYHIGNTINFICICLFFAQLPVLGKYRRFIYFIAGLFTLINIWYKIQSGSYNVFDSFGFGTSSIVFTCFSFLFYATLLQQHEKENLLEMPGFWLVTGILIYYACCFFVFIIYRHYTILEVAGIGALWKFQNCMLAIMTIFIVKGFQCQPSRRNPQLL